MSRRQEQLVLASLVLWAVGWGLRAVILDTAVSPADSLLGLSGNLVEALRQSGLAGIWSWANATEVHPPLPYLVATLLALPFGVDAVSLRASSVLLLGVVIVQTYALARRLQPGWEAALPAALLAATSPTLAGWFRLDYQEPLTTVLLLATLHLLVIVDLRRPWPPFLLGLAVGLGCLTKLGYNALILAPGLTFLALRLRSLRQAALLLPAALVAVLLYLWWLFPRVAAIVDNFRASTSGEGMALHAWRHYVIIAPGNLLLSLAALAGIVLAWRFRLGPPTGRLILSVTWVAGYLLFFLLFDVWGRYIVPLLPVGCVLAGLGIAGVLAALRPRRLRAGVATLAVAAAALAVWFVALNLRAPPAKHWPVSPQRHAAGIISPDRRDYSGVRRALALMASVGCQERLVTALSSAAFVDISHRIVAESLRSRRPVRIGDAGRAQMLLEEGQRVCSLEAVRPGATAGMIGDTAGGAGRFWRQDVAPQVRWLRQRPKRLLGRLYDDAPLAYEVYLLERPPARSGEPAARPTPAPDERPRPEPDQGAAP